MLRIQSTLQSTRACAVSFLFHVAVTEHTYRAHCAGSFLWHTRPEHRPVAGVHNISAYYGREGGGSICIECCAGSGPRCIGCRAERSWKGGAGSVLSNFQLRLHACTFLSLTDQLTDQLRDRQTAAVWVAEGGSRGQRARAAVTV